MGFLYIEGGFFEGGVMGFWVLDADGKGLV